MDWKAFGSFASWRIWLCVGAC